MKKIFFSSIAILLAHFTLAHFTFAQYQNYFVSKDAPFYYTDTGWAEKTLQKMTIDERIGQLFMVATYSTDNKLNNKVQIEQLIRKYHIGGLIFMQGTPLRQVELLNHYQSISKTPLLVGMDLETGLGFRLKNTVSFPKNMTLGAITNPKVIYETAREIGRQCRRVGVNVNFAPVLDINNNKANPIIGTRSFGDNRENVVEKGRWFSEGLQAENILAVGKHFPGHGDTHVDSHKSLPSIPFDRNRLDSLELYPFRALTQYGIGGMMMAHLQVPTIDEKRPTSLSKKAVQILREECMFNGLIFTDALNMGGVANSNAAGDVDVLALLAGNDMLLFSQNVPKAVQKIKEALKQGKISQHEIDAHVRRILLAKQWAGLTNWQPISTKNIQEDLHSEHNKVLMQQIAKSAITMVKNDKDILPLKDLDKKRIAAVSIDAPANNAFLKRLANYGEVRTFSIPRGATKAQYDKILQELKQYNTVIVAKHNTNYSLKRKFGATQSSINFLRQISKEQNTIFCFFGSPYGIANYDFSNCSSVLVGYEDKNTFREAMAEAIFGGSAITGKLSLTINNLYPSGWGIATEKTRLGYTLPQAEYLNATTLLEVDSLMQDAIKKGAFPGCQVLIAKNGNIVYKKAFGHHTFHKKRKVQLSDIYDLASVTKVSATLPLLMQEIDNGQLHLDTKLGEMLPYFANTDKANITLEDLLTHESGLPSWIPLYRILIDSNSYKGDLISYKRNGTFSLQIDRRAWMNRYFKYQKGLFSKTKGTPIEKGFYLAKSVKNVLFDTIRKVEIQTSTEKKYRYSDLGLVLSAEYLKTKNRFQEGFEELYKKLGAKTTGMNLWKKFPTNRFVPTAKENFMRKKILRGYVHDPNAALLGGVAGHAGLFSNAEDLAKLWQMYLQKGRYGGEQFIQPNTLVRFSKQAHPEVSRRGIGFDKPDPDTTQVTAFANSTPRSSFGHTGFTGTLVWADPENKIIGILLANRVYPHDWNNKMGKLDIRTKFQEIVYKSIEKRTPHLTPLQIEPTTIQTIIQ